MLPPMLVTTRFSLDAVTIAQNAILSGITSGDRARVVTVVRDLAEGDVLNQAVFTAKVSLADADTDPNTIQKVLPSPDGTIEDVYSDGTTYRLTFELEPSDTVKLLTQRYYDVRIWIDRDGQEFPRTVQRGTIAAKLGVTSLYAPPTFEASVVMGQAGAAIVVVGNVPSLQLEGGGLLVLQGGGSLKLLSEN